MKTLVLIGGGLMAAAALLYPGRSSANNIEAEPLNKNIDYNGIGISAASMDWRHVPDFSESEFFGVANKLDAAVVYTLQKLRNKVGKIIISPVGPAAIARVQPGSFHDTSGGRLSAAIDVMPLEVSLSEFYQEAKKINSIGGIGLYPDWKPYPGAHIDLRKRKPGGALYTWSGILLADGKQVYRGIDEALA